MSTFQLFPTAIKAALTCADANHPGKALQGVFVEFHPTETLYVATNGKIIAAVREATVNDDTGRILIPYTACKDILRAAGKFTVINIELSGEASNQAAKCLCVEFMEPGQYPNWRQVFPKASAIVGVDVKDLKGVSSLLAERAGNFWAALDPKSHAVMVPTQNNGFPGYFAIHKTGEGERSKLPNRIKATCFCMGVTGAEAMHRDAVSYGSYFPDAR